MKFATWTATLASALLLALVTVAPAMATEFLPEPGPQLYGETRINMLNGLETWAVNPNNVDLAGDVYNNTNPQAAANFGFAQTNLATIYGDRVATTSKGLLLENDFTIYNSGSSAGALLTATYQISFFNAASNTLIGGFNTNVNFTAGGGLPPGFFAVVTVTNLGVLGINLNTQDVLVTQQLVAKTGTATVVGIASLDPPTIGSSTNTMFISSPSIPAGYYNIGNPPLNANPGYRINVNSATPAGHDSWGQVKALYH